MLDLAKRDDVKLMLDLAINALRSNNHKRNAAAADLIVRLPERAVNRIAVGRQ
jgi:hypothetical protein